MRAAIALILIAGAVLATTVSAAERRPPTLAAKCSTSDVRNRPFWLKTADEIRLYAREAGAGRTVVVLAHESPADLCGWLPYVHHLTGAGLRVLLFDFRGFGDSGRATTNGGALALDRDLRAAVARARFDGARCVFLVGASFGGAAALAYGANLDVDGVISLSGEARLRAWNLNGLDSVRRLRAPLLIVGSRHDRYLPISDALLLLHRAGTHDKRTAIYPGGFHGWDLVEDAPYAARVRSLVTTWIRSRS